MPLMGLDAEIENVPQLIPVMSLAGVFLPIFLMLAIWPVWGFLSPVYMLILSFGFLFATTFLPNGKCGTIIFWVLVIAAGTISHKLPHEGHEHAW